ncbi:MAG TPA: FAD-dependent oxidoreductase [Polyangiaceae bacterium]|nr:FAD-dependent oxidoreductase [Polyangiaceae bacterium]
MNPSRSPGRTQVLVVGAGPVGLLAALRLREQGIDVRVVEQQSEQSARSFPVVLHAQSLRLLSELGLSAALFWRGRPVTRLAVYTEYERRAVLDLPKVRGVAPGLLTLPQDVLRQALLNALARSGVAVEYETRLAVLAQDERSVWGRLVRDQAGARGSGTSPVDAFDADYVIGADGYESTVREALGLRLVEHGALSSFAFFDATTQRAGREAQLALSEDYTNAVYPLQDGVARFSFQVARSLNRGADPHLLRELVAARLPWYAAEIERCTWSGVAEFRRALCERFGLGRVWLAGEAAHLTEPLGVQSLNVGMDEANELALRMADALRHPQRASFGGDYEAKRLLQWRELLGLEERAALSARSPDWARRHLQRMITCLPASEADLDDLLEQLRVQPSSHRPHAET